jgi:hypothetical protein
MLFQDTKRLFTIFRQMNLIPGITEGQLKQITNRNLVVNNQ